MSEACNQVRANLKFDYPWTVLKCCAEIICEYYYTCIVMGLIWCDNMRLYSVKKYDHHSGEGNGLGGNNNICSKYEDVLPHHRNQCTSILLSTGQDQLNWHVTATCDWTRSLGKVTLFEEWPWTPEGLSE